MLTSLLSWRLDWAPQELFSLPSSCFTFTATHSHRAASQTWEWRVDLAADTHCAFYPFYNRLGMVSACWQVEGNVSWECRTIIKVSLETLFLQVKRYSPCWTLMDYLYKTNVTGEWQRMYFRVSENLRSMNIYHQSLYVWNTLRIIYVSFVVTPWPVQEAACYNNNSHFHSRGGCW